MSTSTAPPSSSRRRPRPRRGSRRPARVLFQTDAVVAIHRSSTTATGRTRNGEPIQVSFCLKRPPQPSTLFVHCPDLNHTVAPEVVCSVDDLFLLRVNMGRPPVDVRSKDFDYFVYRAGARPSLELLRHPQRPCFHGCDVGILPRSDGRYTIAALTETITLHHYRLHLFHSETSSWSSSMLSLDLDLEAPPPPPTPVHRRHHTSTVITIGGEGGTMGWVDLWQDILLCDVLHPEPSLRLRSVPLPLSSLPLPLPLATTGYINAWGIGNPSQRRGIAFIRNKGCLKFVALEIADVPLPGVDHETRARSFRVHDWALTTWTNNVMSNSLEDWHKEYVVQASNITIDDPAISRFLDDSGLLSTAAPEQRHLHNLSMYQPSPCLSGQDVVYLVARQKNRHPKAWMLAVNMKNGGRLQAAAYFGVEKYSGCLFAITYRPSEISKYMNPTKYINPAAAPVGEDAEELHEAGAVELIPGMF